MNELLLWIVVVMTPAGSAPVNLYYQSEEACQKVVQRYYSELEQEPRELRMGVLYSCFMLRSGEKGR